jgi:hypothetical protein
VVLTRSLSPPAAHPDMGDDPHPPPGVRVAVGDPPVAPDARV